MLETHGVPVLAYGADLMPAFWSRHSPHAAPLRLDTPEAIARFFETRRALGLGGGMLVGNPVPETDEIPAQRMAAHIAAAQEAANRTIEEAQIIRLSVEDQRAFAEAIVNPAPPSAALSRAAEAHRALIKVPE